MTPVRRIVGGWCAAATLGAFVFRDLCRRRLFAGFAAVAVIFVLGSSFLAQIDFGGDARRFVLDFCFGALALFGAVLTVALTVVSLREPLERGAVALVLARPVGRGTVGAGLFTGAAAAVTLFVVVAGVVIAGLAWRYSSGPEAAGVSGFTWSGYFFALWIAWLRLFVIASMVFLVAAAVDSTAVALLLGFLLVIIGEVHGIAAEVWGQGGEGAAVTLLLAALRLVPDLRYLQPDVFLHGGDVTVSGVAVISLYGLLFAAGYAVLAAYVFHRRAT
ncbi:MAG: hypothetical protein JJU00_14975 [Opitutales bacterium]|nr:hypothetical protein [Opitutales bacterium]